MLHELTPGCYYYALMPNNSSTRDMKVADQSVAIMIRPPLERVEVYRLSDCRLLGILKPEEAGLTRHGDTFSGDILVPGFPASKHQAYHLGFYRFAPPPVPTNKWLEADWIRYIDREGGWLIEVT